MHDEARHSAVVDEALEHGPLAAWFNNAGVGDDGSLAELSSDAVERLVQVNLLGTIWGMRAAMGGFGREGGDIVNIASLSGHLPVPGLSEATAPKNISCPDQVTWPGEHDDSGDACVGEHDEGDRELVDLAVAIVCEHDRGEHAGDGQSRRQQYS